MATLNGDTLTSLRALSVTRCSMCGKAIQPGTLVLIGTEAFEPACAIVAAASIASTVEDGGDESVRDVQQAAQILRRAAKSLEARVAGKVNHGCICGGTGRIGDHPCRCQGRAS